MSVQWYVLRGDQSEGPFTSSELKLLADQRQISPDTLVKQGMSGPWVPAGTIEGLFVEYHGAKPSPSTGSPPPVRYVKPKETKKPVLAVPPTFAQAGAEADTGAKAPLGAESSAMPGAGGLAGPALTQPLGVASQPSGAESSRVSRPALQEPAGSGGPAPSPPEELLSPIWYLRTPDGQQYGPVSKQQLDQWAAEGRVGNDCWLWRAGWPDWQGAGQVYGGLGQPLAPASLSAPSPRHPPSAEPPHPAGGLSPGAGISLQPTKGILEAPAGLVDPQRWIGQTVGHYQLVQLIGRGPSGLVYKAHHLALDRTVAVRLIPTGGDRQLFEQLTLGLRAAVRVTHPHLVEVYDMGDTGGIVYVAMELMEGGSLADWIRRSGRLPAPAVVGIFHQVALALAAVHGAGLLHRDIKPSNILFTAQGVAKLSDLGLAALTEARLRAGPTGIGSTAYYLAPELFQGQPPTVRSDLYSLGATFYHALSGHAPGEGMPVEELIRRRGDVPVQPIGTLVAGLPPILAMTIDRLLLKDPSLRFSSAKEVLEMLERMGGQSIASGTVVKGPAAPSTSLPGPTPLPVPIPPPAGQPDTSEEGTPTWWIKVFSFIRSVSWKVWLGIAGAGLLAIILGILLLFILGGGEEAPPSETEPSSSSPIHTPITPPEARLKLGF
ncbi:MAG: protein kinase [Thermoguttaceae bacterium]|nr:protein kinase [Thermoguttaceae bacterium]MDW8039384.1 protein kinase [Thermoguttaceae bacterium]